LEVWERGRGQGPLEQSLALLAAACAETSPDELATRSIGRRDSDLLTLREQTFGSRMSSVIPCPMCGEKLELSFSAADLRGEPGLEADPFVSLTLDGFDLRTRVPNSLDLAAAGELSEISLRRRLVLERCLITAYRDGQSVSADQLPAHIADAVEERMAQADPQADIRLEICCPACSHRWLGIFDIVSFFWSEIEAWAIRILHEVHLLASAYGWHEREILTLSPWRRQFYLERAGG
jgi:hypothetical protein